MSVVNRTKPVILIVDDDDMNTAMAKTIMEMKISAEYITASSGRQCLHLLQQRKGNVDLILLDIAMPGMDGLETLEKIRQHPEWQSMPVIFLTASADKDTIVRASRLRISDYVRKPFVAQDLIERVERTLTVAQLDTDEMKDLFSQLDQLGK